MESLGNYLRTERELQTRTLKEAAKATKVRIQFLEAIEEDRYELLPRGLYLKGFLFAYARYLGLDPHEVFSRYQKRLEGMSLLQQKPTELKPQIQRLQFPRKRGEPWILSIVIFAMLLFVALSMFYIPYSPSGRRPHTVEQKKSTPVPLPVPSPLRIEEKMKTQITRVNQVEISQEPFFEVIKAGIGTGVEFQNDHLVLKGKSVQFGCNDQKIYFFTRIRTQKEEKIAHVWCWEGKEYHAKEIDIKPPEYSVYSYLTLRSNQSGNWRAEVRVGETVLTGLNFKVTESHPVKE